MFDILLLQSNLCKKATIKMSDEHPFRRQLSGHYYRSDCTFTNNLSQLVNHDTTTTVYFFSSTIKTNKFNNDIQFPDWTQSISRFPNPDPSCSTIRWWLYNTTTAETYIYCSFHIRLATTFLLLAFSSWNFHDVCQRFFYITRNKISAWSDKRQRFPHRPPL